MQYVRSFSGSVSKTWNSINPSTLSGAIDVIVVEQEDGTLACSPFHVRFGKFSLLRPYEKRVEFKVNNVKQDYAMKLGEGGEAFFVFETSDNIPQALQTSPLVSPTSSPTSLKLGTSNTVSLQEPDFLDLDRDSSRPRGPGHLSSSPGKSSNLGAYTPLSTSPGSDEGALSGEWAGLRRDPDRAASDHVAARASTFSDAEPIDRQRQTRSVSPQIPQVDGSFTSERSGSPPPLPTKEAVERAIALSKQLSASNIPSHVTDTGDLMLDMTGYKSSDEDALRAEVVARKILSEELEGNYDIGALIGADEHGNLWIYSSEEAKEAASQRVGISSLRSTSPIPDDNASDPGYQSDEGSDTTARVEPMHRRADSAGASAMTPPKTPPESGDSMRSYAKTLRLTSDQLKALNLRGGCNSMSFTVNRATCEANMFLWFYKTPVVISDIDGTITKSDALGHVLTMIGRDWTHIGVAKLYTEIVANGYNIMYLTSRGVGQADTTRAYLKGVVQDNYRLPKGPTITSPDRTIAAIRREIYLRKPEIFKMACLRDIKSLYGPNRSPFYAGFGNRLTDALSYRSVSIPSNRIFTINSYAEVSLDLLSLNKLKLSYVNMREVVDHYFPPVGMGVEGGGEEFTDFTYWRSGVLDMDEFSASESDGEEEEEEEEEEVGEGMVDSYVSRNSEMLDEDEEEVYDDDEEEEGEEYEDEDGFHEYHEGEEEEVELGQIFDSALVSEPEEEHSSSDPVINDKDEACTRPKLTSTGAQAKGRIQCEDSEDAEIITGI